MFCPHCGSQSPDGNKFCMNCGGSMSNDAPVTATAPVMSAPIPAPADAVPPPVAPKQELLSKRKFLKLPENKKVKSNIISSAVLCYISAVITIAVGVASGNLNLIDPIALLVLGLFIHIGYSIIASFILAIYGVINVAYMIIEYGKLGGYLILIAGVYAVVYTIKAASRYKKYKKGKWQSNQTPDFEM